MVNQVTILQKPNVTWEANLIHMKMVISGGTAHHLEAKTNHSTQATIQPREGPGSRDQGIKQHSLVNKVVIHHQVRLRVIILWVQLAQNTILVQAKKNSWTRSGHMPLRQITNHLITGLQVTEPTQKLTLEDNPHMVTLVHPTTPRTLIIRIVLNSRGQSTNTQTEEALRMIWILSSKSNKLIININKRAHWNWKLKTLEMVQFIKINRVLRTLTIARVVQERFNILNCQITLVLTNKHSIIRVIWNLVLEWDLCISTTTLPTTLTL